MGLLELAQQRKDSLQKTKDEKEKVSEKGLRAKAQQMMMESSDSAIAAEEEKLEENVERARRSEPVVLDQQVDKLDGNFELIDERKGFGWKGLGCRRIVYNYNVNEYQYLVDEPVLSEAEKKIKNELVRMFKMLADVSVYDMDKEKKEEFLEDTLERIIIDLSLIHI